MVRTCRTGGGQKFCQVKADRRRDRWMMWTSTSAHGRQTLVEESARSSRMNKVVKEAKAVVSTTINVLLIFRLYYVKINRVYWTSIEHRHWPSVYVCLFLGTNSVVCHKAIKIPPSFYVDQRSVFTGSPTVGLYFPCCCYYFWNTFWQYIINAAWRSVTKKEVK